MCIGEVRPTPDYPTDGARALTDAFRVRRA